MEESGICFTGLGLNPGWSGEEPAGLKVNLLVRGKLFSKTLSVDILADGKFDVSEILDYIAVEYYNITDEIKESETEDFVMTTMGEMVIDTRPIYPSSRLTFNIADVTENRDIRFFNIYLNLNGIFDVDVVLEDSKRNFLNSQLLYLICFH